MAVGDQICYRSDAMLQSKNNWANRGEQKATLLIPRPLPQTHTHQHHLHPSPRFFSLFPVIERSFYGGERQRRERNIIH